MNVRVKRWMREYELTFANKRGGSMHFTLSLSKNEAAHLAERLAALLAEVEHPHKEGPK